MLGDVLAEHFRLKAQRIRILWGLGISVLWLIGAIIVLVQRIIVMGFILSALDAPYWVWIMFWIVLPVGILVEQIESKKP